MSRYLAGSAVTALALTVVAASSHAQVQSQRLLPQGPLTSDIFSYDTAFDGSVAVMGAPFATYSGVSQPGRAFIFEKSAATWVQTAKLQPPVLQEGAAFGTRVACGSGPSGEIVVIGAAGEDGAFTDSGAVYVFEKLGGTWTLIQRLVAPVQEAQGRFGSAIEVSGGVIAVGSPGTTIGGAQYAGSVFLFEKLGGFWQMTAGVNSPDPDASDTFGAVLSLDHDRLAVIAPLDDADDAPNAGACYTFHRVGPAWVYDGQKLQADPPVAEQQFGTAVAIKGSILAVAAENAAVELVGDKAGIVSTFAHVGADWVRTEELSSPMPQAGAHFGTDVAIDGRSILVGSYLEKPDSTHTGAAHVFRQRLGEWWYDATLKAGDTGGTLFGWRLGLAGDTAVIGGPFYQTNRGAAYVFTSMRSCPADIDGTGFVDTDDFDAFVHGYEDGAWYADMDSSGFVDTDDFDTFVHAYEGGC